MDRLLLIQTDAQLTLLASLPADRSPVSLYTDEEHNAETDEVARLATIARIDAATMLATRGLVTRFDGHVYFDADGTRLPTRLGMPGSARPRYVHDVVLTQTGARLVAAGLPDVLAPVTLAEAAAVIADPDTASLFSSYDQGSGASDPYAQEEPSYSDVEQGFENGFEAGRDAAFAWTRELLARAGV